MKNNKWFHLTKNLFVPIIIIIIICFFMVRITELNSLNEKALIMYFNKINSPLVKNFIKVSFLLIIIRSYYYFFQNKKKELIPTSVYGDIPVIFYILASILLNIKKINLKCKPIPLQFQIFKHNGLFDIDELTEIKEKDVKYQIDEIKGSTSTINILIGDTYDINKSQIPSQLLKNKTIIINRKKRTNRCRFNSNELITIINTILERNKKCKEYNLFLFTNPVTNRRLYDEVFNTTTDGFIINVYNAKKVNDKCYFQDKKVKIKL